MHKYSVLSPVGTWKGKGKGMAPRPMKVFPLWLLFIMILLVRSNCFITQTQPTSLWRGEGIQSSSRNFIPLYGSSIILPSSFQESNSHDDEKKRHPANQDMKKFEIIPEKSLESNFWFSVPLQQEETPLPNMPYLDSDGDLPPNAYQVLSSSNQKNFEFDKKPTCLITVSVGLDCKNIGSNLYQLADSDSIVQGMQKLIDSGITSFQIEKNGGSSMQFWGESNIYKTLKQMMPTSVLDNCNLSTRVNIPSQPTWMNDSKKVRNVEDMKNDIGPGYGYGRGEEVRRAISGSLIRMETDCLDSVQVVYRNDSPYCLETLNTLYELQEEGKIRSITGLNFPPSIMQKAQENGFTLDANQAVCNIIDQRSITDYPANSDTNAKMLYSSTLLGGILTDPFFFQAGKEPDLITLSPNQRQSLSTVRSWGKSVKSRERVHSWTLFHKYILSTLHELSLEYEVSMSSIAVRYIMQKSTETGIETSTLGSLIIGSRVGFSEEWMENRPNQLREIFRFELADEHMERLDEVSSMGNLPELYPAMNTNFFEY